MNVNEELRYEIGRANEHSQNNFVDCQKMNDLIAENYEKNEVILELQQDTERMQDKMKSMQKIVDKSNYNDLVKGLARCTQSAREDHPQEYFKDPSSQEKTGANANQPTNTRSRLKPASNEFSN